MPSAEADKVKSSWVAEMEDEAEDTSDRKVEIRDNTKTISEITYVDGEKVKLVRHFRIEKRKVTKEAAVRKTWKKFGQSANDGPGPNSATTIPSDDVRMEFLLAKEEEQQEQEQVNSFGGNQNVQCRNCGLNHWTLQCPYKNQLNALNKLGDNSDLSKDDPRLRKPGMLGALGKRGMEMPSRGKDENNTIRITNLPEETQDSDIRDLFKDFGRITRIFLAKDKATGNSKGVSFLTVTKMFDPFSIALATLFALFWLMALASHIILLKLLLTPYERVKLRLPAGSWPLLLTLTIADLVALLTALPFTSIFAIFNYWFFGEVLCDMSSYVKVASLTVSSYVILGLLMQSYEMVVKTPRPPMSTVKLGLLIGSICLLAVVTALPMLFTHKVYPVDEHNHRLRESLETFELYEDRHFPITQKTAMETLATNTTRKICAVNYDQDFLFYPRTQYFFLQFAVPLAIVFFLFIKITDTMNKQGKSAKNKNVIEEASRQQLPQDWKFVRTILILTVVFYLSWAPVNFFIIFLGLNNAFRPYAVVLSELTFFIKPLLLFAVNTNFRNALRTIGVPTIEVEDANSYQVGFSKVDEEGGVY